VGLQIPILNRLGRSIQDERTGRGRKLAPRQVGIKAVSPAKTLDRGVLNIDVLIVLGSPQCECALVHRAVWVSDECALIENPCLTNSSTCRACAALGVLGCVEAEAVTACDGIHQRRVWMNTMHTSIERICMSPPEIRLRFVGELDENTTGRGRPRLPEERLQAGA
jgi:hypothetical protein